MALVKYNNNSISSVTSAANFPAGAMTLISTTTASSSSTISITSGIDSTYPIYLLKFINVHPSANGEKFQVNFRDGSTAYDATKTTTAFESYQNEAGSSAALTYQTGNDLAQSTGAQHISDGQGNENDESCCGQLFLFSPSSTTYVKHFLIDASTINSSSDPNISRNHISGYFNTSSAIDAIQFKFASGTIDAGTIQLFGVL